MIQFKKIEITTHELLDWKRNQLYNPRTSRKIIKKGRLFNYIQEKYNQVFPLGFDIFDSNDERDPISLKYFYKYDLSNNKQLVYTNINNLILYQESESIIRCFEKESIQVLIYVATLAKEMDSTIYLEGQYRSYKWLAGYLKVN